MPTSITTLKEKLAANNFHNVIVLDDASFSDDDVVFIGATLWTDYDKQNPLVLYKAPSKMREYKLIHNINGQSITPKEILDAHNVSRDYIISTVKDLKSLYRKVLVITHHAPSWASVPPPFIGDEYNSFFVSDLSTEILDSNPDYWIHGHTHYPNTYEIGYTKVIINPMGYPHEKISYNPTLLLDV